MTPAGISAPEIVFDCLPSKGEFERFFAIAVGIYWTALPVKTNYMTNAKRPNTSKDKK